MRTSLPALLSCSLLLCFLACADDAEETSQNTPATSLTNTTTTMTGPPGGGPPFELPTFIQPTKVCRPSLDSSKPGAGADGDVCTWEAISGATERGRRFADYASCEAVRTQRPYYPMPPHDGQPQDDPRMKDPEYVKELDWVKSEIAATGCACCHSMAAPNGPVRWTIDAPGNWVNTFNDRDLAASAEWIDTSLFGRVPKDDNNGFERREGYPSTDPDRILSFFEKELAHRGLKREDFANAPPTGGPLLEQTNFKPQACTQGEGVKPDGTVVWEGGPARYIYVLEPGSINPTIPPNLDTPEGTLWRLDVLLRGEPLLPGKVRYGTLPKRTVQRVPEQDQAPELVSGKNYYLYVTRDVFQPITRCLFQAP